jgi:membrane protease YdiL (CAAX protease family)
VRSRARQWIKPAAYIALAAFSCLLFSAFTPPLLTPLLASRLPLIGSLPGDQPSYWFRFILSFLLLGLVPAIMALSFREKPRDLGLRLKVPLLRKPWFWLLLPAAALVGALGAASSDLGSYYPYSRDMIGRVRESGMLPFFGHFAAYFFLYYLPWEFFFRGFLLFPFALAAERAFGAAAGGPGAAAASEARTATIAALVLFQTIPSTMLHFGHPLTELASAVVAGLLFGALAWKTRSIVPGLLLHASIGFGTDLFIVLKGARPA